MANLCYLKAHQKLMLEGHHGLAYTNLMLKGICLALGYNIIHASNHLALVFGWLRAS